jgi:hypothetical protein
MPFSSGRRQLGVATNRDVHASKLAVETSDLPRRPNVGGPVCFKVCSSGSAGHPSAGGSSMCAFTSRPSIPAGASCGRHRENSTGCFCLAPTKKKGSPQPVRSWDIPEHWRTSRWLRLVASGFKRLPLLNCRQLLECFSSPWPP